MNNTYKRQVQANPANVNPNQHYIEQYDAMAQLGKQMVDFGTEALNLYAKADYEEARASAKKQFDEREAKKQDLKRRVELSQDARGRESAYKKGLEAIDKEYGQDIDSRFEEDFANWSDLADKKDLLDLRFNVDRDLQKQAVDKTFDHIEQAAKQSIGANEAYVKMLDESVRNDLNGMLSRGAITQLQYDKALRNYNESKLYNNLNHRLIVDPEGLEADLAQNTYGLDQKNLDAYRIKTANALKNIKLKEDIAAKAQDEANTLEALKFINMQKDVPQNLLNRLPEKVQSALQERAGYLLQGQEVPTNPQVYDHLRTMFTQNPAHFKDINLFEYAGDLSAADLSGFKQLQAAVVVDKKGRSSVDPTIKRATDLMDMAYAKAGIAKSGADDAEKRYQFNSAYTAEVEDFIAVNGRKPTRSEDEAIINKLTKETVLQSGKWYTWANDKQAWRLEPEDYTKAMVDYDEISETSREGIKRFLATQNIPLSELSASEQKDWIEKFAGTLSLPNSLQKAAMRERLQELRIYLSNKI
nr:MAG TPA: hypothetical protein [Bacteriophage sp.]